MLMTLRQRLSLVLITLLPFHAFAVTLFTKRIYGSGHAPAFVFVVWKEVFLALILLIACIECVRDYKKIRIDIIDIVVLLLGIVAASVTLVRFTDIAQIAYGIKYDFAAIIAFVVLRRVQWSEDFASRAMNVLLITGGIVAVYGFVSLLLPLNILFAFGYGDLHSLYVPGAPLAPFQQIESLDIRRMQSVMSGPNQLGLWLLLPLSCGLVMLRRDKKLSYLFYVLLILAAVAFTFSRSAWLAAAAVTFVILAHSGIREQLRVPAVFRSFWIVTSALLLALLIVLFLKPSIILRPQSTLDHVRRPIAAVRNIAAHPLGLGLGTAGPASNRFSDTCVVLDDPDADIEWAKPHNICVFRAGIQVQPTDRPCLCPVLPENWYLQIGMELGIAGLLLFIGLTILLLKHLPKLNPVTYAFLGISIAALFLHAWEDSAVAYSVWLLAATAARPTSTS